jgi:hypothetical protein
MGRFAAEFKARWEWPAYLPQAFDGLLPALVATHFKSPRSGNVYFNVVALLQSECFYHT